MLVKDKTLEAIHISDTRQSTNGRIFKVSSGVEIIADGLFANYIQEQKELLKQNEDSPIRLACQTRLDMIDEITTVVLPKSLKTIGKNAFRGLINLTHISFPDTLEEIGEHAFYECENIEQIYIPQSLQKMGKGAFERCDGLLKVFLPIGLKIDKAEAFWDCSHVDFYRYKRDKNTLKTQQEAIDPHLLLSTDSPFYQMK